MSHVTLHRLELNFGLSSMRRISLWAAAVERRRGHIVAAKIAARKGCSGSASGHAVRCTHHNRYAWILTDDGKNGQVRRKRGSSLHVCGRIGEVTATDFPSNVRMWPEVNRHAAERRESLGLAADGKIAGRTSVDRNLKGERESRNALRAVANTCTANCCVTRSANCVAKRAAKSGREDRWLESDQRK